MPPPLLDPRSPFADGGQRPRLRLVGGTDNMVADDGDTGPDPVEPAPAAIELPIAHDQADVVAPSATPRKRRLKLTLAGVFTAMGAIVRTPFDVLAVLFS